MTELVFPKVDTMNLHDLKQMVSALYRDDRGWRILVRALGLQEGMDISDESGEALWQAMQEDGHNDVHTERLPQVGVATTWALKPNAYGRLLTDEDAARFARLRQCLVDAAADLANPKRMAPRGRRQRVRGVQ